MAMSAVYTNFGGMLVFETRGGTQRQYISDPLGSLVGELDSTQATTYTAEYWPYGEIQTESGTNTSNWSFVGLLGYLKDLTSLLYVRARHYLTNKGRWLTVDPIWPVIPAYGYCAYNPVTYIDYTGLKQEPVQMPTFLPADDVLFKYGWYCGARNCEYGPNRPEPLDCVDRACQEHDDCLLQYGNDLFTFGGSICNCKLAVQAQLCLYFGCWFDNTPIGGAPAWGIVISPLGGLPWVRGVSRCQAAAAAITTVFFPLCLVTPITGVVQGAISLGSKLINWGKSLF